MYQKPTTFWKVQTVMQSDMYKFCPSSGQCDTLLVQTLISQVKQLWPKGAKRTLSFCRNKMLPHHTHRFCKHIFDPINIFTLFLYLPFIHIEISRNSGK